MAARRPASTTNSQASELIRTGMDMRIGKPRRYAVCEYVGSANPAAMTIEMPVTLASFAAPNAASFTLDCRNVLEASQSTGAANTKFVTKPNATPKPCRSKFANGSASAGLNAADAKPHDQGRAKYAKTAASISAYPVVRWAAAARICGWMSPRPSFCNWRIVDRGVSP